MSSRSSRPSIDEIPGDEKQKEKRQGSVNQSRLFTLGHRVRAETVSLILLETRHLLPERLKLRLIRPARRAPPVLGQILKLRPSIKSSGKDEAENAKFFSPRFAPATPRKRGERLGGIPLREKGRKETRPTRRASGLVRRCEKKRGDLTLAGTSGLGRLYENAEN